MKAYGFEEKRIEEVRRCPICGEEFIALTQRRRYCYKAECQEKRYQIKLTNKKSKWRKKHFYKQQTKER